MLRKKGREMFCRPCTQMEHIKPSYNARYITQ
jgi:hypothetical protein